MGEDLGKFEEEEAEQTLGAVGEGGAPATGGTPAGGEKKEEKKEEGEKK